MWNQLDGSKLQAWNGNGLKRNEWRRLKKQRKTQKPQFY